MARERNMFFFSSLRSVVTIKLKTVKKLKIQYHFIFLQTIHFCPGVYLPGDYYSLCLFLRYFVKLGHLQKRLTPAITLISNENGPSLPRDFKFSEIRNKKAPDRAGNEQFFFMCRHFVYVETNVWTRCFFMNKKRVHLQLCRTKTAKKIKVALSSRDLKRMPRCTLPLLRYLPPD